ncbi:MAG: hypothetical protein ABI333_17490 [bacterium]
MDEAGKKRRKRDLIAQWAFDTRPILGRLHLWLEDVEVKWLRGEPREEFASNISFLDGRMERLMAMTAAVTALGTQLFGRYGEGVDQTGSELNRVKKDADAVSAYAMSESLWYASRSLPENHAIMVCMGEGLMPKSGETQEMGSNPQLGFGRVYARPEVAKWLDQRVTRLLNDDRYGWSEFWREVKRSNLTIWGMAIDTLENTTRFAKGELTGPMTIMHLFSQPVQITRPYEGYMGNLFLPKEVAKTAADQSVLMDFRTPRAKVVEAIDATYPEIRRENIHVWTLQGKNRMGRLGKLWQEWRSLGAHLVDDGWILPSGLGAFTESGTYAPVYRVGTWLDAERQIHMFIVDGYAASAEAIQAVSLAPILGLDGSLVVFTSKLSLPLDLEQNVMGLDTDSPDFAKQLEAVVGLEVDHDMVEEYKMMIRQSRDAGLPHCERVLRADDFFPEKQWDVVAISGYMCPDPYSGIPGIDHVTGTVYRSTVRLATRSGDKQVTFTLRLQEKPEESRLVFNPLLTRFIYGEDFRSRPVKISDSGRIRNELQTLCSEALEYREDQSIEIHFARIPPEVISPEDQVVLLEVLHWYKEHHPLWFHWLKVVPRGGERGGEGS